MANSLTDICESAEFIDVGREPLKACWSEIEASSYLVIEKSLSQAGWGRLLTILNEADVSRIRHLELELPRCVTSTLLLTEARGPTHPIFAPGIEQFAVILESGRFSALTTLKISVSSDKPYFLTGGGDMFLSMALRKGQFHNLLVLSLPRCDVKIMFGALTEGHIFQLSSFSFTGFYGLYGDSDDKDDFCEHIGQELDAVLTSGCFKNLHHFALHHCFIDTEVITLLSRAGKNGLLPNMNSFCLTNSPIEGVDLEKLVPLLCFHSLETLVLKDCQLRSKQACLLFDAISEMAGTTLKLKCLDLQGNNLEITALDALVRLANSDRLPQLQKLDLSENRFAGVDIKRFTRTIQRGHLPRLHTLNLGRNESHGSYILTGAAEPGLLQELKALCLRNSLLEVVEFQDMVPLVWFHSLETLTINGCLSRSEQLCAILDALPETMLPLKCLDLQDNHLGVMAIDALVRFADSDRLQQLEILDLSHNCLDGFDLKNLTETIVEGHLPRLRTLHWGGNGFNASYVLAGTIESGCSYIESICLTDSSREGLSLVGLVPLLYFWPIKTLTGKGCNLKSEQVYDMVDAIMKMSDTGLTLKCLDLSDNGSGFTAVDALVRLSNADKLLQLEKLDLSDKFSQNLTWEDQERLILAPGQTISEDQRLVSSALGRLMNSIQNGHLPMLQTLNWAGKPVSDPAAEAIMKAYYENEEFTAIIYINWTQVKDQSLKTKVAEYRGRNLRLVELKKHKKELQEVSPLTCSKVFLCGFPEVGKTKLRKTLCRPLRRRTKFVWETRPNVFKEPRTRGIELSRIEERGSSGDNLTLVLWDLAGQNEFHVLHGTFLADLGFAGGKATTFVPVLRSSFETDSEAKLMYWLRFVAASSLKHVKRHVVIVLNCFGGKQCTENAKRLWMGLIRKLQAIFDDLLDIHLIPFIIDVRVASSVKVLKDHLFNQARRLLRDVTVPRICFELKNELKVWSKGEKEGRLPILTWQAFEKGLSWKYHENYFPRRALKSAASYLHEIGEMIYLNNQELTELKSASSGIVVPDPEWFCRRVVGQLLLPKEMLEAGESVIVNVDGSIPVILFESFFVDLLAEGTQSDDVIQMLEQLGLCYRKGKEHIVVPTLIQQDDYNSLDWEGKGFHWVMGRCLATEDKERSAIPLTLFRHLQVQLAQDPNLGGRGDSGYRAGRSFSSFKAGELCVLIQFDVDHADPNDDRIDILVKSLIGRFPTEVSLAQVKCICDIQQKLEILCVGICPGLRYDIKVIQPWSTRNKTPSMVERKLMALREIKNLFVQGHKYLSWQISENPIELETFLSENELKEILNARTEAVKSEYDACEQDAVTLGLLTKDDLHKFKESVEVTLGRLTEDDLQEFKECVEEKTSDALGLVGETRILGHATNEQSGLIGKIYNRIQRLEKVVRVEGHHTRQHIDRRSEDVILEIQLRQSQLVRLIQAQQAFSFEEKESSVPRYLFLSRKQGKCHVWISLKEAFQSSFVLHLLCEAHFKDGFLHEVNGQVGIELKKNSKWLQKISPWLQWSLKVIMFVSTVVGHHFIPGIPTIVPNFWENDGQTSVKAVSSAARMLLEEGQETTEVLDGHGNYGTAAQPVNLKERLIAEEVIKDLIRELGHAVFAEKIALRKVVLRASVPPHIGGSEQNQPSVVWICDECYKKYGERATDITPRG